MTTDAAAPGKAVKLTAVGGFPDADAEPPSAAVISGSNDRLYGILGLNDQTGGDISQTYSANEMSTIHIPKPGFRFWGKKAAGAINALAICDVSDAGDFEVSAGGTFLVEKAAGASDTHVLLRYLPAIS